MLKTQTTFFHHFIIKPLQANLALVMFWFGLFLVFIGALFGAQIDQFPYLPSGIGQAILKGGSAILGAGVFAVIMKSAQFTELFQNHIYDVFYDPQKINRGVPLIVKWQALTHALLKALLPGTHHKAASQIEMQFLNAGLEYHFEEHAISYDISIDACNNIATVRSVTNSTIILSPNAEDPVLKQTLEAHGNFELLALRLNDKKCNINKVFEADSDNPNLNVLRLPLKKYALHSATGSDKVIKLERVMQWTQDLQDDPYIKGIIQRYIKGAKVSVKVAAEYKVHFERFGLGDLPDEYYLEDDGFGYERWQLVTSDNLLLPGQGFILMVIPRKNKGSQMKTESTETI